MSGPVVLTLSADSFPGLATRLRELAVPVEERRKLSLFCNVRPSAVIQALDAEHIYDVPAAYHREGLDREVLAAFGITGAPAPRLDRWHAIRLREGFVPIRAAWLAHGPAPGTPLTVRGAGGHPINGRFAGIAEDGRLLLRPGDDGPIRAVAAGEVLHGGG